MYTCDYTHHEDPRGEQTETVSLVSTFVACIPSLSSLLMYQSLALPLGIISVRDVRHLTSSVRHLCKAELSCDYGHHWTFVF